MPHCLLHDSKIHTLTPFFTDLVAELVRVPKCWVAISAAQFNRQIFWRIALLFLRPKE
jgi:hypothetical protein